MTIAEACQPEQPHLLPLAEEVFGIHETLWPLTVDGKGCVRVKTNWYSTPLWPGLRVTARVWPTFISVEHDGKCAATHPRNYGRGHQILDLEHYLDVLEKKPGAMAGSTPLAQWKQAGDGRIVWIESGSSSTKDMARSGGTREMIGLVRAGLSAGWDKLIHVVEEAISLGVSDPGAVLHILHMPDPEKRRLYAISVSEDLAQFERPLPVMDNYDLLLALPLSGKGRVQ